MILCSKGNKYGVSLAVLGRHADADSGDVDSANLAVVPSAYAS